MNKLKYLKVKIRILARLHKENLNSRKSILKTELPDLDGVIDKGEGSDVDGHRRREVVRLIQEVEKVDAMEVAQKDKIKWSIKGDENSKYYHGVLNKKRGRPTIRRVLVDGIWMESKHEFFEHFKNRFEKPNKSRILLERDFVKRISLEQNDDLEREVSNEEIKKAVWDCGIDKAPGSDGFTFGFYRRYWDIIGNVVVDVVKWFLLHGEISNETNSGRSFFLNEIVHWCKNRKKQSMIFKVDFEKVYDSVRWDFIDDILRRFGFGEMVINMNKSNLMGIFVDSNKVKHAATKICCLVLKTPFNYLGSRVGDLMSRIQSWHHVTEGMHTRLSKWKVKTISIGGRLTLLKYVLGTIPIYHMSMFKVSMKALQNMESIRMHFFNGVDVNSKKPSWVRWKSVLAAKDVGGLGVSSLFALNWALMFKWVWRFFSQKNSLWVRVVKALHGEDGKIAWCGDIAFKNLVPRLYALESMKNIEVASKLSHGGLEFSFRRNPRGGLEQAQFERLKEMVEGVTLRYFEDEMDQRDLLTSRLYIRFRSESRYRTDIGSRVYYTDVGSVIASGADLLSRVGYDPENKEVISGYKVTREPIRLGKVENEMRSVEVFDFGCLNLISCYFFDVVAIIVSLSLSSSASSLLK
nr:RNA-directed DNA polymerase, eukaryota, reverse transcriptase zinc-binding domain protein [Tanacetum cinerariifolium]